EDPSRILDLQWKIEAELLTQSLDDLLVDRIGAEKCDDRVTWNEAQDEEDDDAYAEGQRDDRDKPLDDVIAHRVIALASRATRGDIGKACCDRSGVRIWNTTRFHVPEPKSTSALAVGRAPTWLGFERILAAHRVEAVAVDA